jgi:hypothetical protein
MNSPTSNSTIVYLKRLNIANTALIAVGALLAPLTRIAFERSFLLPSSIMWSGAVLLVLIWRTRDRQRHETETWAR